jgi:hypothetical protein
LFYKQFGFFLFLSRAAFPAMRFNLYFGLRPQNKGFSLLSGPQAMQAQKAVTTLNFFANLF